MIEKKPSITGTLSWTERALRTHHLVSWSSRTTLPATSATNAALLIGRRRPTLRSWLAVVMAASVLISHRCLGVRRQSANHRRAALAQRRVYRIAPDRFAVVPAARALGA